ncbi:MAG TPA: malate dehydrogenase [Candidatus Krumholzibacteria bacterium]|nr:malate dehydrogenase [Candidatus Krumholzibacteria bacterium]HPD70777.1 malate dehydrogenase [Candidatus Krumholzibacteria bacterium]HRY39523.1 malate dehydrogenase [Candidatus Krumholzibacteria bacterium]
MVGKIGIIGGGNIGGVCAAEIASRRLARRVALVDVKPPEFARGKCLDIAEGTPVIGTDTVLEGSKGYEVLAGADFVINTAGVPRAMRADGTFPSREELLATNLRITDAVAAGIRQYCPDAFVVSIANPLDAIVYRLHQQLKDRLPVRKLMGMAGVLDSARYKYFVAQAAGVSVENVEAVVLGGHGDTMVPIRSACRIYGLPVTKFIDEDELAAIEDRVRKAGGEVVSLLGSGSAFVSPAWSALEMITSIAFDKKKITSVCAHLDGEYGVTGLFVGVPAILGREGVEKIIEIDLSDEERTALANSVAAVSRTCAEVDKVGK